VSMCQYMGLPQYGADAFLRFQLRSKMNAIKEDDRRILWEGIDVLTTQELREACQERYEALTLTLSSLSLSSLSHSLFSLSLPFSHSLSLSFRGMKSVGLTQFGYKRQLQEWLDLSIQKSIPISLLIMSRAFMLTSSFSNSEDLLRSSISSLDSDTINEVVLANARTDESDTPG
jgi:LETM1 and EF-hand domain-containing protein 1